jgi:spermidine synthase
MKILHDAPGSHCQITVTESESTRFLELNGCEEGAMHLAREAPVFHYLWFQRCSRLAGAVQGALVLGAGAFTASKCLALDHPAAAFATVDIEAGLEPVARRFFRLERPEFARIAFHGVSAEAYLASATAEFDFIFDDLFDGFHHVPNTSRVPEHFEAVRRRLRPGGVFVKNLIWAPRSAATRAACAESAAAARAAFPRCAVLCLGPDDRGHNRLLIAGAIPDADQLLAALLQAGVPKAVLTGATVRVDV